MKNFFIFLIIFLISINLVSAVGIKWYTEAEYVSENSEKCIKYGAYNPSSNDIKVEMSVVGSLQEVIKSKSVEDKVIKVGTSSSEAEDINFCFEVPKVYEPNCLIGSFLCEQKCGGEPKIYKGNVVMTEESVGGGGQGSATSISATAPLELWVNCVEYERDWSPAYLTGILIVLILLGILFYKKYSAPKLVRDEERLKELQDKVEKEKEKK